MRKLGRLILLTSAAVIALSSTAFAGTWKESGTGWYWEEEDGSRPASTWKWLDGDQNGVSECYYFDPQGNLLTGTTTPDGSQVDAEGRWVVNGEVQTQGSAGAAQTPATTDARQMYEEATRKTNSLNGYAAKATMVMNMTAEGTTIGATADMEIKVKDADSSAFKYLMTMDMNLMGQNQKATMFYTDGYSYVDMAGQKIKVATPYDKVLEDSRKLSNSMFEQSDYFQDIQVAADANGNQVFTFTLQPDNFNELLKQVSQGSTDLSSMANMSIREYRGTATVNQEGYFTACDIVMVFDAVIMETAFSYDVKMHMDYVNPGQPVDFTLPSTEGYTLQ